MAPGCAPAPRAGPRPQVSGRQGRTARAGPPSVQRAPRVFPRCLVPASWGVLRTRFSLWSALPSEPGIGGEVDPVPLRERGCGNRGSPTPVSVTAPSGARSPSDRRSGDRQPAGLPEGLCVCVCAPHTGPSSGRRRRTGTDRGTPRDIRGPSEATPLESRAHVRHPRVTVGGGQRHSAAALFGWSLRSLGARSPGTDGGTGPAARRLGFAPRRALRLPPRVPPPPGRWVGICSCQPRDVCGGWAVTQSGAQSGGLCWLRGSRLRARARCTPLPRGPRVRGSDRWVSGHAADLEWAAVSGCVSGTPHSAARQGRRPGACAPWGAPVPRPRSGRAGSAGPRPPPSIPAFMNAVSEGSQAGPPEGPPEGLVTVQPPHPRPPPRPGPCP